MKTGSKVVERLARELNLEVGVGRGVWTPAAPGQVHGPEGEPLGPDDLKWFRSLVGMLQYIAQDRPDIQYVARSLARVMTKATTMHLKMLQRVVKYLLAYPEVEHVFEERDNITEATCYVDANWGGEPDSRSVSGGVLLVGQSLVLSWSRTQGSTALSTAESELYAIVSGVIEVEHISHIIEELTGMKVRRRICTDSSAAKSALEKAGVGKMRHIALRYMYIKEVLKTGLSFIKVQGTENMADLLTKALDFEHHTTMVEKLPLTRKGAAQEEERQVCAVWKEDTTADETGNQKIDMTSVTWVIGLLTIIYGGWQLLTLAVRASCKARRRPSTAAATQTAATSVEVGVQTEDTGPTGDARWIAPHRGEAIHSTVRCSALAGARGIRRMHFCSICG